MHLWTRAEVNNLITINYYELQLIMLCSQSSVRVVQSTGLIDRGFTGAHYVTLGVAKCDLLDFQQYFRKFSFVTNRTMGRENGFFFFGKCSLRPARCLSSAINDCTKVKVCKTLHDAHRVGYPHKGPFPISFSFAQWYKWVSVCLSVSLFIHLACVQINNTHTHIERDETSAPNESCWGNNNPLQSTPILLPNAVLALTLAPALSAQSQPELPRSSFTASHDAGAV